jgi:hypothetical protein
MINEYREQQREQEQQLDRLEQPQPPPVAQPPVPEQLVPEPEEPELEMVPSKTRVLNKAIQFVWLTAGVLQGLIGIRILLKLMAANPESGFARFVYGTTDLFLHPFMNLTVNPAVNGVVLEISSLIAMLVYALFFWLVVQLIWLLFR